MDDDVTLKCFRCGKNYPASDMRFKSSNNNDLICKFCLSKKTGTEISSQNSFGAVRNEGYALPKKSVQTPAQPDVMVSYKCGKCGYSFKRKSKADVSHCPYCGNEEKLSRLTTKSANSLLRESMGL